MKKALKTALGCASLLFLLTGCSKRTSFEEFRTAVAVWKDIGVQPYGKYEATIKGTWNSEEYNFTYGSDSKHSDYSADQLSVISRISLLSIDFFLIEQNDCYAYYIGDGNYFSPKFMIKGDDGKGCYGWNTNLNITKIQTDTMDFKISYVYLASVR